MNSRHDTGGFTLIELLVVLTIMAVLATMAVAYRPARLEAGVLKGAADRLASDLRAARVKAITTGRTEIVAIDLARPRYTSSAGANRKDFPENVGVLVTLGDTKQRGPVVDIVFAADGSASGGVVALTHASREERVGIDWLTGRVTVTP